MRKMYFVGVTTGASSVHRYFSSWTRAAGIADAVLEGIDIPVGGDASYYVDAMRRMAADPECEGALVTTHKVNLLKHARQMFTGLDADAEFLSEVSCIVKRRGQINGLAMDTITAGLAVQDIYPAGEVPGQVLILGAGGAATALALYLRRDHPNTDVVLTDIDASRLAHVKQLTGAAVRLAQENDMLLASRQPGSLIVNATGAGKDLPGSPLSAEARFPRDAIAWDFNYRGDLLFLDYAAAQGVRILNGWDYFLHGWSRIMAEVYGFALTPALFAEMKRIALP